MIRKTSNWTLTAGLFLGAALVGSSVPAVYADDPKADDTVISGPPSEKAPARTRDKRKDQKMGGDKTIHKSTNTAPVVEDSHERDSYNEPSQSQSETPKSQESDTEYK